MESQVLMERNGFSLLLVPRGNEGHGVREFRVSGTGLVAGITAGLFAVVVFVAMTVTYGSALVNQVRFLQLQRENDILRGELVQMEESVLALRNQMDLIAERDEMVRHAAELDPIAEELRRAGVGGTRRDFDREVLLLSAGTGSTVKDTQTLINQLHREAALELESLLEIGKKLSEEEAFFNGFPSIWPIDKTKYRVRVSDAYGNRTHPVTGAKDFHEGNDIVAAKGTPVRATADGRIARRQDGLKKGSNFLLGNYVKIDHGNGFETYYGHLDHLHARSRLGAQVKRGDIIGYVGNTGRTTGYHLHYEIHNKGKDVNPWHYYYDDRWIQIFGGSH